MWQLFLCGDTLLLNVQNQIWHRGSRHRHHHHHPRISSRRKSWTKPQGRCFKFYRNRWRGFRALRGQKWGSLPFHWLDSRPYNRLLVPCCLWCIVMIVLYNFASCHCVGKWCDRRKSKLHCEIYSTAAPVCDVDKHRFYCWLQQWSEYQFLYTASTSDAA